ncbi:MAG: LysR family transcriptional regulator [Rivularia sp. (in: Bacteria)]|nr:LysR family transcriptional regulator [Rivularia sp. MS3]
MTYLTQLRTFIEAYRLGSLTQASERLGITQPAVSSHIRTLEVQLKKKLFIRHARGIDPTAIAHDLARSIGSHIDNIEIAFSTVQARAANIAGTIHIAAPGEFLHARLAPVLAVLMAHDIKVRIHPGGKDKIYSLLDEGAIDLAITASKPHSRALGYKIIAQETFVLVAATNWVKHNLSRRSKPVLPADLLAQPLIAYDEDLPLIRQYFEQVFSIQIDAQPAAIVGDLRIVLAFILEEQGYSVLPEYLCKSQLKDGSLILLHQPINPPTNNLYLVWNRGNLRHPRVVFARECLLKEFDRS